MPNNNPAALARAMANKVIENIFNLDYVTSLIPFFNGQQHLKKLLLSLPAHLPVIVIDDHSDKPLSLAEYGLGHLTQVQVIRPKEKGYFTGAVNVGMRACQGDVLILNQDTHLSGVAWLEWIEANREQYALIGERIKGDHPAWPAGYIHGTFMYIRRDLIDQVGLMDAENYPLWGSTCEYQLRAYRQGYEVLMAEQGTIPGFHHSREGNFGSSIQTILQREPHLKQTLVRTPPLISVVVGAYNHGRYLPDLINSLIGGPTSMGHRPPQTLQSFEIVIVNDGSTDDTHEIMLELADPRKGIRYIKQPNRGSAAAINTAISAARGQIISVMDADDMAEPERLEQMYKVLLANPHSVVCDSMRLFGEGDYKRERDGSIAIWQMPLYVFDNIIHKNTMHKGLMYPKLAWQQVGGYPEVMDKGREDWAFNVALGIRGWCGVRCDYAGYMYRREGQNRTLKNTNPFWRDKFLQQMFGLYPQIYAGSRPMGCCGKNKLAVPANGKGASAPQNLQPGQDGMVLLEYNGLDAGTSNWWGEYTGQRYIFGGSRKRGLVDANDAPGFLSLYEGARRLFVAASPEPAPTKKSVSSSKSVVAAPGTADPIITVADLADGDEPDKSGDPAEALTLRQDVIDEILAMNVENGRNAMIEYELTEAELLALKEGELAKEQPRTSITRHADRLIARLAGQQAMAEVA